MTSLEDLIEYQQKVKLWNDLQLQDWQRSIKPGDYFVCWYHGLTIYCEVQPYPEDTGSFELDRKSYLFIRAHSQIEPHGELGLVHRTGVDMLMTSQQFEQMRAEEWPILNKEKVMGFDK